MGQDEIRAALEQTELLPLGVHASLTFANDPKHLVFSLARYKFVSKMFEGYESVLEVGCGDAFGSTLVAQTVQKLVCIDSEPYAIEHTAKNPQLTRNATLKVHDILQSPIPDPVKAVFALDVIEHIPIELEDRFMENIVASTMGSGVLIMGTPNITSAQYASRFSQIGHINLKSYESLKETLSRFYRHVFMFGMNDEVVHTGYAPMCHYLIGLAVEAK
ncbi:MAG: class I SAM-dependent methyltransferase [SAR202 cluster bacterium]|nr:class I SAM-dependent methyltransferase [SAR202 cluster bacterium]